MTHDHIEINPAIMFGKPVIKGRRITVEHILRKLSGGMTVGEIVDPPLWQPPLPTVWVKRKPGKEG